MGDTIKHVPEFHTKKKCKMTDKFSFQLSEQDKSDVNTAIQTLVSILEPKLITLTPEERMEMPKMGDKTVSFVEKAIEYAQEYPQYMPAFIDIPEAELDFNAVKDIRVIFNQLQRLTSVLDDSMILAGSEAYSSTWRFIRC